MDAHTFLGALAIVLCTAGVTTILNPAPADAPVNEALLQLADLITPNETEFAELCLRILGEKIGADDVSATRIMSRNAGGWLDQ